MSQPPDRFDVRSDDDELTGAQVARLGLSNAAAFTADRIHRLVSTQDDQRRPPGKLVSDALDALKTMNKVVARAVLTELMRGTTEEELADVLRMNPITFVSQYGHLNITHLQDDPDAVWATLRPTCPADISDTCPEDPAEAARWLDEWMRRHLDPREAAPTPAHPVSAGL